MNATLSKPAPAVATATATLTTPLGAMHVSASDRGIQELLFDGVEQPKHNSPSNAVAWMDHPSGSPKALQHLQSLKRELTDYFAGRLTSFKTPTDAVGTTFQKEVWHELVQIRSGETISYGELARRIGRPSAVRAVAQANARNPLCIIVPCHRVIAQDGSLSGYAGGPWRKQRMLDLESRSQVQLRG